MDSSKYLNIYQSVIYKLNKLIVQEDDEMIYDGADITIGEVADGYYPITIELTKSGTPINEYAVFKGCFMDINNGQVGGSQSGVFSCDDTNITGWDIEAGLNYFLALYNPEGPNDGYKVAAGEASSSIYLCIFIPDGSLVVNEVAMNVGQAPG